MTVRLIVRAPQVMRAEQQRLQRRLLIAADLLATRARRLCSRPAQRITRRVRAGRRGPEGQRRSWTEYVGSRPGEPPRLRTGYGRTSITWWRHAPLVARVGIRRNAIYMAYLETGTRHIARRPWLSRAVAETRRQMTHIITAR